MSSSPRFDSSKIQFPTDRLTLGDLRHKIDPDLFKADAWTSQPLYQSKLMSIVADELRLAKLAFNQAAGGIPSGNATDNSQWIIEGLLRSYEELGIGSGQKSRLELVKKIQKDSEAQTRIR